MEQASDEPEQQWSLLSEEEAIEDEPENEGDEAEPSKSVNVDKCKAKLEHLQKELAMLDTDGENIVKTQVETLKASDSLGEAELQTGILQWTRPGNFSLRPSTT